MELAHSFAKPSEQPDSESHEQTNTATENIDAYEREKIEVTLQQVEHLAIVIKNYLELVKLCDDKGIEIQGRQPLDALRLPDGPAGPNSDLLKLAVLFQNGMSQISSNIHYTHKDEVEARMETAQSRFRTD